MFSGKKITLVSQSLVSSIVACSLLIGAVTLAGPRQTNNGFASQPFNNPAATRKRIFNAEGNSKNINAKAAALSNASIIRNVSITKTGGGITAIIELDGQAKYNHFTLPSPYRLVVDVQNVTNTAPPVIEVGELGIKRVRVGKMDDVVRIVFDADKQQRYQIVNEDNRILITFGEAKFVAQQVTPPGNAINQSVIPKTQLLPTANNRVSKAAPVVVETAKTISPNNFDRAKETKATKASVVINNPAAKPQPIPTPVVLPDSKTSFVKAFKPAAATRCPTCRARPRPAKSYEPWKKAPISSKCSRGRHWVPPL